MQINRANYENYFLRYVDNELSIAEIQAVKGFLLDNNDLAAELDALLETKLIIDSDTVFLDKKSLFRTALNTIIHEEQFLLFLDNELTTAENEQMLAFLETNAALKSEYALLEQSKLPQENISFGDKSTLYRKEASRPLAMGWWRISVAAALIGLTVLVWNLIPAEKQKIPIVKASQSVTFPSIEYMRTSEATDASFSNKSMANQTHRDSQNPHHNKNKIVFAETAANNNAITALASNEVLPTIMSNEIISSEQPTSILTTNNTVPTFLENADHANQLGHATLNPDGSAEPSIIHQNVYKELDTDDESKSLYLGNLELNAEKLRGIFRRAGTLLKSKIN